ncbi:MAG: hypothetical protein Q8O67_23505 [Deltaproteobacteria bacterium]|nr:hypothetical protein [Deltaproteobacteria bacterium]
MSPQALLLTILFVADDPQAPMVVIDVIEDGSSRSVDVVVVPRDRAPISASLASGPAETAQKLLRTWPLLPTGSALTPAADGAILTIDDIGLWEDPAVPPPVKPAKAKVTTWKPSMTAPDLRVASPVSLRLFLPAILDQLPPSTSTPAPVPASLHGSHTRLSGTALVVRKATPVLALSLANNEADGGAALVATSLPGSCAPIPSRVVQPLTSLSSTSTTCTRNLGVSRAVGKRFGEKPEKDLEAAGVVVVRLR